MEALAQKKVTRHQLEVLRSILAWGGVRENQLHMGRTRKGMLRKTTIYKLRDLGLVEWQGEHVCVEGQCGRYYVTAAGCRAVAETV
jgi:hypothetical protein